MPSQKIFREDEFLSSRDDEETEDDLIPSGRHFRRIVSLLMLAILLIGVFYTTAFPFLREVFQSRFTVIILSISDSECSHPPPVTLGRALPPTDILCVCGQLYSEGEVSYTVRLRDEDADTLKRIHVEDQRSGPFCHVMRLDNTLGAGRYLVDVTAGIGREPMTPTRFSIRNPDGEAVFHN